MVLVGGGVIRAFTDNTLRPTIKQIHTMRPLQPHHLLKPNIRQTLFPMHIEKLFRRFLHLRNRRAFFSQRDDRRNRFSVNFVDFY